MQLPLHAPVTEHVQRWNPRLVPAQKKPRKPCLQKQHGRGPVCKTEEEGEEKGKERALRGSLGGLTSFKDSWESSMVVVVVDPVAPAP